MMDGWIGLRVGREVSYVSNALSREGVFPNYGLLVGPNSLDKVRGRVAIGGRR